MRKILLFMAAGAFGWGSLLYSFAVNGLRPLGIILTASIGFLSTTALLAGGGRVTQKIRQVEQRFIDETRRELHDAS